MNNLSKESIRKILASLNVSNQLLKEIVTNAYIEGDLDIHDTVYENDEEFSVIFKVDGEMFKINLSRNSYGDIYPSYGDIKGPLKAVEKTVTVYE